MQFLSTCLKAGFHMIANDRRRSQRDLFPYNSIIADDRRADCRHTFRSAEMSYVLACCARGKIKANNMADIEEEILLQANLFLLLVLYGSIFCDRLRSRSQAIAEVCFHMIADDRRTFCDPRSSAIIWKPALRVWLRVTVKGRMGLRHGMCYDSRDGIFVRNEMYAFSNTFF